MSTPEVRLGYVILFVPDVPAAMAFYEKAFGLAQRFTTPGNDYGEMETGATALAFAAESLVTENGIPFRPTRPNDTPFGAQVTLVTGDVLAAYNRALAAGAVATHPPTQKPWGQTVATVRDLNGALVELATPMLQD